MKIQRVIRLVVVAFFAYGATHVVAGVILPTLAQQAPGSQYQLIFVTAETTDATSADVFDYDNFAAHEAGQNTGPSGLPSATWDAVVSTPTTNAIVTAPSSGLPVYNTQGIEVASSSIYSGSLLAAVQYDQFGNVGGPSVWTGTDSLGVAGYNNQFGVPTPDPDFAIGNTDIIPGNGAPIAGRGSSQFAGSVAFSNDSEANNTFQSPIYALSAPITVPESVQTPEPATISLLGSALMMLGGYSFLRQRRTAIATKAAS